MLLLYLNTDLQTCRRFAYAQRCSQQIRKIERKTHCKEQTVNYTKIMLICVRGRINLAKLKLCRI